MLLLIQAKAPQAAAPLPVSNLYRPVPLSFFKAQAVRALIHGGIRFMRPHPDRIQAAILLFAAVVRTLRHTAVDRTVRSARTAVVSMIAHKQILRT